MDRIRADAAPVRPGVGEALSRDAFAADRVPLPVSSHLLGLCRPGAGTSWAVGRRVDDLGAAVALPPVGQFRTGFCSACPPARCALVSAVELWPLARNQRGGAGRP